MRNWISKTVAAAALTFVLSSQAFGQCSICTRTAAQQGKEAATGLNGGIVYLMILPFAVGGVIALRWWRTERANNA
jgi:hypothetical protein